MSSISRRDALKLATTSMAAAAFLNPTRAAHAEIPRVLPAGKLPDDVRLGSLKDYNGYFPWTPYPTKEAWEERAEEVRRQILVACGLWPMPARPPVEATIHGKVERDDYTVERVSFESHPGLYVTGSLYRPKTGEGRKPAVICPHGHWADGRFYDHGEAKVKQEIELGAEKFEMGGRHPKQARSVHLARMGCVVFLYDMLGYADNQSLSFDLIHKFGQHLPERSTLDHWGLFSAQSELRLLNALGLQTWNSIRILDWLETLPDVDPTRIGVTGASGGGTQTFLLGCVDPRPVAFFPAVMVSTAMQGGCTCENASYLRVNTGNIEFAALLAPRVVGLGAANDWTKELETKGLPELQKHFEMLGVPSHIQGKHYPFEHNFNHVTRAMMYGIFRDALGLGDASLEERDYVPLTLEEATVWDAEHPQPPTGDVAEQQILRAFTEEFDHQLAELTPHDAESFSEFRRIVGGGWQVLIGRTLSQTGEVVTNNQSDSYGDGYLTHAVLVRNETHKEELPAQIYAPENWNRQLVIWLTETGKTGLLNAEGEPNEAVSTLLKAGYAVAGVDLLYQGEFLADGQELTQARLVPNPREFLGYTVGYNHPLFSQRVHDVLTLIQAAQQHPTMPEAIHVVGTGKTGLIAAAAAAVSGDAIGKLAVSDTGFRFAQITEIRDPYLLPGALRYGDVGGLLALRAPLPLLIQTAEPNHPALIDSTYAAVKGLSNFRTGPEDAVALVKWLQS
ncbi:acetylxylan esterase [bacterium]|nr:acetylxylan esterase [bacterium]